MPEKLKSALKTHVFPLLPPIIKAGLFGAALFWAGQSKNFFALAVFLLLSFYLYFRKLLEWRKFFYAFFVLTFYSLIVVNFFAGAFFLAVSCVFFALLFFMLLGSKNFIFLNRDAILNFFYWTLYFIVVVVFFAADKNAAINLLGYSLLTFLVLYLLLRESLDFSHQTAPRRKKQLLAAASSFLAVQVAQIIRWLPLGFLNAAVMTTLLIIVLEDLIFYHLRGELNRQNIIKNAIVLITMMVLIFLAYSLQI